MRRALAFPFLLLAGAAVAEEAAYTPAEAGKLREEPTTGSSVVEVWEWNFADTKN